MTNLHDDKKLFNDVLTAAAQPKSDGGMGISLVMLEKDYWLTRHSAPVSSHTNFSNCIHVMGNEQYKQSFQSVT